MNTQSQHSGLWASRGPTSATSMLPISGTASRTSRRASSPSTSAPSSSQILEEPRAKRQRLDPSTPSSLDHNRSITPAAPSITQRSESRSLPYGAFANAQNPIFEGCTFNDFAGHQHVYNAPVDATVVNHHSLLIP
jgi:hypothetical protein